MDRPHLDKFPVTPEQAAQLSFNLGGAPTSSDVRALRSAIGEGIERDEFLLWHQGLIEQAEDDADSFWRLLTTLGVAEGGVRNVRVPWKQLNRILTSVGDVLSQEEFAFIASLFASEGGDIDLRRLLDL